MQRNIFSLSTVHIFTYIRKGKQSCLPVPDSAEKPYLGKMKLCQTGEGLSQAINSF